MHEQKQFQETWHMPDLIIKAKYLTHRYNYYFTLWIIKRCLVDVGACNIFNFRYWYLAYMSVTKQ